MGNCSSCIGDRRRSVYEDDDETQHLFDDPNALNYNSFDQQHMAGPEDPQEVQREIEALQRVVARTSDNMVDIYDIVPEDKAGHPTVPTTYAYAGWDPHMARYQTLLSKLSSHEDLAPVARVDWGIPDDDTIEMQQNDAPVKLKGHETLVGNFADAAAAMR